MKTTRRDWLKLTGTAALATALPRSFAAAAAETQPLIREYEKPMFDLPGQVKGSGKTAGGLLGGVIKKEIPIYLSGSDRILTAEQEVDVYVRGVKDTGAQAVKFKIGGRMSRNLDTYPGRTEKVLTLAREKLGDKI